MCSTDRPSLPYVGTTPGIYQVCSVANTDYPIEIPANATGCVIWFDTAAGNNTMIEGRVAFSDDDTAITSVDNTDALMGYHPAWPLKYTLPSAGIRDTMYLHVATTGTDSVVRGFWLFQNA